MESGISPGAGRAQLPNRGALLFGAGLRHDSAEHHRRAGHFEVPWMETMGCAMATWAVQVMVMDLNTLWFQKTVF